MKSKSNLFFALALAVVCFFWGFAVRGQGTGPFCDLCQTVQLTHMTETEWNAYSASLYSQISSAQGYLSTLTALNDGIISANGNIWFRIDSLYSWGQLDQESYDTIMASINDISYCVNSSTMALSDANNALGLMASSIGSVVLQSSEFCVACTASGTGGDTGGDTGSCSCNCPDYTSLLQEISNRLQSMGMDLNGLWYEVYQTRVLLEDWKTKWIAQDEKLSPLIDELKPMLPNIKKFYDDYYSADWGTATWSNIKNIVSDLTEKEIVKKWDRYYGDYYDSTMSSASWSSFAFNQSAAERVYKADTADGKTGEQTMISILKDWQESTKHPISESYTLPSEVPDEKEYVTLNWFQRITAALGVIAFSPTNISNQVDLDFDEHEEEAKRVENAVVSLGTEVSSKFGSLYGSYKNIFDSFKNLVPRDTLPTSIRLHPGFKFDYNPAGSSGGDQSAYVLPPWDWAVQEHAIFKIALDMIRGIFGFIWWVLGFGIVYEIVVGVYSFCVSITQKAMAVFGSLGRSGGGSE